MHIVRIADYNMDSQQALENHTIKKDNQKTQIPLFLLKLYEIVDDETTNDIIAWQEPRYETFIIWNPDTFCKQVLPQYFKHGKFSSFIRQLNMYDFHKQNRKTNYGQVFYHPFFKKDMKHLITKISRKTTENQKNSGSGKKRQEKAVGKAQSYSLDLENTTQTDSQDQQKFVPLQKDSLVEERLKCSMV